MAKIKKLIKALVLVDTSQSIYFISFLTRDEQ
jgi:hypothetical protein